MRTAINNSMAEVKKTKKMTVGDEKASVGEAPLVGEMESEDCGCDKVEEVDVTEVPELPEEDEESSQEALEIARTGLNNYMAKKSKFDELYSKVISEDFGMEEQDDLNALGIEDATPDTDLEGDDTEEGGGEEVTVTLDKEVAKTLCDLLQAAMGDDDSEEADFEDGDEDPAGEGGFEEDNEGELKAHTTSVDMGTNNKVGSVDGLGGQNSGHGDGGKSAGQQKHSAAVKDGKSNKVGNLAKGKAAFGDLKVEPAKKVAK